MLLGDAFKKLKSGLTKTRDTLFTKVATLVSSKSVIDDEMLDRLEEILISGDVGVETTMLILDNIKKRVREEKIESSDHLVHLLKEEIAGVLRVNENPDATEILLPSEPRPYVVMVVGVNGVGKTTSVGKLANVYREGGRRGSRHLPCCRERTVGNLGATRRRRNYPPGTRGRPRGRRIRFLELSDLQESRCGDH
jgi:signal recognition particle GTPase